MASIYLNNLNRHLDKIFREKKQELFAIVEGRHCKNCRWWSSDNGFGDTGSLRYCRSSMTQFHPSDDLPEETALSAASSTGNFYTGPEFGCVHFESKEGEKTL